MTTTPRASFTATLPPVGRPDRADMLGRLVPTAIRRPPKGAKIPNPFRLTLVGLLTAGVVPAAWLVQRAGRVISQQSQQIDLAVDLIESSGGTSDADAIRQAAKGVTPARPLMWVAGAALVVAIVAGVGHLVMHDFSRNAVHQLWFHRPQRSNAWSLTSLIALSACPLIVIAALNRHAVSLQQFAIAFNASIGPDARGESLQGPNLVWGLRPVQLVLGIALAALGIFWGLPMMLGWAAYATMCFDTTQRFRTDLADRLQGVSGVEPSTPIEDHCIDSQCRAALPSGAHFCPRCGKAVPQ